MEKINVYNFCMMFYKGQEIRLHVRTFYPDGSETCYHANFSDKFDDGLFKYRDCEVTQFTWPKRNVIDIIAIRDLREDKDGE